MHGDYYALLLHLFFSPFVFLLLCIWHFLTRWWADYCSQKSQVKAAITHAVKMPQRAASLADWFQPALRPSQIVPRCLCVTFCFLKQKNRLRRLHVPKSCGKSVQQVKKKKHTESHVRSKWKSTAAPDQSEPCWELTYLCKNTHNFSLTRDRVCIFHWAGRWDENISQSRVSIWGCQFVQSK